MSESDKRINLARQWIEKAEHDLLNAEHTLKMGHDCPYDTVCFHAQQCAEKYLKGFLTFHSVEFPKTHDLRVLMQHASAIAPLALDMNALLTLNRYPIEARYPGDWETITREDAVEALAIARKARAAIKAHLPEGME